MEVAVRVTIIEATHGCVDESRLARALPGPRSARVGAEEAEATSALLLDAGRHDDQHAVDAAVAEMARCGSIARSFC